jgi:hypothetical protein
LAEVFLHVRRSGIVDDDDLRRMAIPPKVLVVFMNGLSDIPKTVGRDYKVYVRIIHNSAFMPPSAKRDLARKNEPEMGGSSIVERGGEAALGNGRREG